MLRHERQTVAVDLVRSPTGTGDGKLRFLLVVPDHWRDSVAPAVSVEPRSCGEGGGERKRKKQKKLRSR